MSDSDLSSGDPWDLAVPAPEPTPTEVVDDPSADAEAEAHPPPPPVVERGDAVDEVLDAEETEVEAADVDEAEVPSLDDFDTSALSVASPDVPELDVPDLDMSEISGSPIDVSDLAETAAEAVDLDVPDVDFGEVDMPDLDIPELDSTESLTDIDFGAIENVDAEFDDTLIGDAGVDVAEITLDDPAAAILDPQIEAVDSATGGDARGPMSAMLAGTGLFGGSDSDEDDAEVSEDGDSDVPDLVTPSDSPTWGGNDSELPDDSPEWLDQDSDTDIEEAAAAAADGGDPPSVYKELEELGKIGGNDQPTEESVADFGALYGSEDEATDDAEEDDAFGISFGSDEQGEEQPEDEDIARVAAMVADVEPIIETSDGDVATTLDDQASPDLDWLDSDDEITVPEADLTTEDAVEDISSPETAPDDTTFDVGDETPDSDFSVPEVRFDEPDEIPELPDSSAVTAEEVDAADSPADDGTAASLIAADPFGETEVQAPEVDAIGDAEELVDGESEFTGVHAVADSDDEAWEGEAQPDAGDDADGLALLGQPDEPTGGRSADWGSRWEESQQGWVDGEWRPIVATGDSLAAWSVDVYLGVVVGDSLIDGISTASLASARSKAIASMLDDATARGAHAVVSVASRVEQVGSQTLVTVSGTAVTLTADGSAETP